MVLNHDLYKPPTDLIYSSKYIEYDVREDEPLKFVLVDGNYVLDSTNNE